MHFTGGAHSDREVILMLLHFPRRALVSSIFLAVVAITPLFAQEAPPASSAPPPDTAIPQNAPPPAPKNDQIIVPTGTRLPLILPHASTTPTPKPAPSIYSDTPYPTPQ